MNRYTGDPGVSLQVADLQVSLIRLSGNGTLKQGDSVNLTCDVNCTNTSSQFMWSKNNQPLNTSGPLLHFPSLTAKDSGNYTCTWRTNETSGSKWISVQVEDFKQKQNWMVILLVVVVIVVIVVIVAAVIYHKRKSLKVPEGNGEKSAEKSQVEEKTHNKPPKSQRSEVPQGHAVETLDQGEVTYASVCVKDKTRSYSYPLNDQVTQKLWCSTNENSDKCVNPPYVYNSLSDTKSDFQFAGDDKSNCTLLIHQLKLNYSAKYKFRFITNMNRYTGDPGVSLQVADLQVSLIRLSGNGTLKQGDSVNLTCDVNCTHTSSQFMWSKNNQPLNTSGPLLHFPSLTAKDSGNYTCTWRTSETSGWKSISVQMEDLKQDQNQSWIIILAVVGVIVVIGVIVAAVIFHRRKSLKVPEGNGEKSAEKSQVEEKTHNKPPKSQRSDVPQGHAVETLDQGEVTYASVCVKDEKGNVERLCLKSHQLFQLLEEVCDSAVMDVLRSTITLLLICVWALSAYDDTWSIQVSPEVRTIEGYPAVLPCSFTHPAHTMHSSMNVVWRLGHSRSSTVLFRCSSLNSSQQCETGPDQDQRYRLEGNHREHDLTLRISSTGLQDNGRYYCSVELPDQPHGNYENKMGTRLRVEAPPQILSLSIGGSMETRLKALCQVQGSPLPDVQWTGLDEVLDSVNEAAPLPQEAPDRHRTTSQLLDIQPGGQYTCTASNPLGNDQATVYILSTNPEKSKNHSSSSDALSVPLLLGLALAVKCVLFLGGLGGLLVKRHAGSNSMCQSTK
ncbi:Sialic acid-binding Ig-like lectin 15 [Bagarius yarrelli]|uniref:Sialic acid-binding Ig-like lectin 15 n=1 Tax=Bagarius yarrelli TaxID=175774 RepID=A0A556V7H0_BAGYA|nr:Sialic acid-binding Ig-like lectin 15 [Bagarius yarrelli]